MTFSEMMENGDLKGISERCSEIMDKAVVDSLRDKINTAKQTIGRRLASAAVEH